MEHKIIAAMAATRANFDRVDAHLEPSDFSPEGSQTLRMLRSFYKRDPDAQSADLDIVKSAVIRRLTNPKHHELFNIYFHKVKEVEVSGVNIVDEVLAAKREVTELALADAILSKQPEQVTVQYDKLGELRAAQALETEVVEEYQGLEIEELIAAYDPSNLIQMWPPSLNRRLDGGLMRGHHMLVSARPEAGKTAIVLSLAAGAVHNNRKVLYIGNEDPIKTIVMRFISRLSGMNKRAILSNPQMAMEKARKRKYDNMVFAGLVGGTVDDLRALCDKHEPDVVIVDQLRNLTVGKTENRTTQLESAARGVRGLGREFDLVAISVTQAGDSASNKLILDMGDIDGSNTGIPGACDVMLMCGVNESYEQQDLRMFKLAKNKTDGPKDNWVVSIVREQSRIRDLS